MTSTERLPFPFKTVPVDDETQKKIAKDFLGYPNRIVSYRIVSCNHWGFKLSSTVTPAELEDMYNYPLDPRDVWVVTPPKCGTTWTQEMVWLIANDLNYEGAKTPLIPVRWEFMGIGALLDKEYMSKFPVPVDQPSARTGRVAYQGDPNRPSPKFVKSHLPMSMNNPRLLDTCKVVYVARNPKDACVSYYNHHRLIRFHEYVGDLKLFMQYFMDGNIVECPIIEHMIEAWNIRHHPNMCYIFYEDMKRDLRSQIRKVAKFLGKSLSDEQVDKLADHLHIDNFKKNEFVNIESGKKSGIFHTDRGNFIRKGKTGDWKNHFTAEMNDKFTEWMDEKLKGTDLQYVTELEKQD